MVVRLQKYYSIARQEERYLVIREVILVLGIDDMMDPIEQLNCLIRLSRFHWHQQDNLAWYSVHPLPVVPYMRSS
jgi:hypothetical protein